MQSKNIAVIGGGAAGLTAAIVAARCGAKVNLYERNGRVGKKILTTGNGRCNFTNEKANEWSHYHGQNAEFVVEGLRQYSVDAVKQFFKELGIWPVTENEGKVFPRSLQASSVLNNLRYEIDKLSISVNTDCMIKEIKTKENEIEVMVNGKWQKYDRIIIATGGCALPTSGSDGNMYSLLEKLGHNIITSYPVLTQLVVEETKIVKVMKGVRVVGQVQLLDGHGQVLKKEEGDILFTDYGLSGPPLLQLSGLCAERIINGEECTISLNIMNTETANVRKLLNDWRTFVKDKSLQDALVGLVHQRIIHPIIYATQLKPNMIVKELSEKHIDNLAVRLTNWKFKVANVRGFEHAQSTGGGVNTWEIDSQTMMSYLIKNLYLAGEILDIYGDCGGYNLHWAWVSGMIAGTHAAK